MPQPTQLLFLPGAGGSPRFWQPVADRLVHPAARRLLGWPGFGEEPCDPHVQGMQDLVRRVVSQIDQPTALIAQSMGGVIAVQAALECPARVTHLVLAATSGGVDMSGLPADDWRPAYLAANPDAPRWFAEDASDMSAALGGVARPVLLLWGDADPISPVGVGHRLQALLPNSQMHVLAGGAHDFVHAMAPRVAPLIDAYLAARFDPVPLGRNEHRPGMYP